MTGGSLWSKEQGWHRAFQTKGPSFQRLHYQTEQSRVQEGEGIQVGWSAANKRGRGRRQGFHVGSVLCDQGNREGLGAFNKRAMIRAAWFKSLLAVGWSEDIRTAKMKKKTVYFPSHQPTLQISAHQLGVLRFNSTRTLTTWSQCQIPQV